MAMRGQYLVKLHDGKPSSTALLDRNFKLVVVLCGGCGASIEPNEALLEKAAARVRRSPKKYLIRQ